MATKFGFTQDYLRLERAFAEFGSILGNIVSRFNCRRCGECCVFDDMEYGAILTSFESKHFGDANTVWLADNEVYLKNPCPFFADSSCKTNMYKPQVCRMHPFGFDAEEPARLMIHNCGLGKEILLNYLHFLRHVKKKNISEATLQEVKSSEIDSRDYFYVPYMENIRDGFGLLNEFLISCKKRPLAEERT